MICFFLVLIHGWPALVASSKSIDPPPGPAVNRKSIPRQVKQPECMRQHYKIAFCAYPPILALGLGTNQHVGLDTIPKGTIIALEPGKASDLLFKVKSSAQIVFPKETCRNFPNLMHLKSNDLVMVTAKKLSSPADQETTCGWCLGVKVKPEWEQQKHGQQKHKQQTRASQKYVYIAHGFFPCCLVPDVDKLALVPSFEGKDLELPPPLVLVHGPPFEFSGVCWDAIDDRRYLPYAPDSRLLVSTTEIKGAKQLKSWDVDGGNGERNPRIQHGHHARPTTTPLRGLRRTAWTNSSPSPDSEAPPP